MSFAHERQTDGGAIAAQVLRVAEGTHCHAIGAIGAIRLRVQVDAVGRLPRVDGRAGRRAVQLRSLSIIFVPTHPSPSTLALRVARTDPELSAHTRRIVAEPASEGHSVAKRCKQLTETDQIRIAARPHRRYSSADCHCTFPDTSNVPVSMSCDGRLVDNIGRCDNASHGRIGSCAGVSDWE